MKLSFVNPNDGLLRPGWRIAAFIVGLMAFNAAMFISIRAILGGLPRQSILPFLIFGVSATVSVYVARRFLDRQSFQSLGLRWDRYAALDLIAGVMNSALHYHMLFLDGVYITSADNSRLRFRWVKAPTRLGAVNPM